jgi:hypothetical protein
MEIVQFFYTKEDDYHYCEKTIYPDGEIVLIEEDIIDWSRVEEFIGDKYVMIFEDRIVEAGNIINCYMNEEGIRTIHFQDEIGDLLRALEGDNNG